MSKSLSRALSFLKSKSFRAKKGKLEAEDVTISPVDHRGSAGESALAQIGDEDGSPRQVKERLEEDKNFLEETTVLSEQDTEVGENNSEEEKSGSGSANLDEILDEGDGSSKAAQRNYRDFARKLYFVDRTREKQGSLRFQDLAKKFHSGEYTEETVVWYKDLGKQFVAIKDLADLCSALREDAKRKDAKKKKDSVDEEGYDDDFDSAEEDSTAEEEAAKAEKAMPDAWRKVSDTLPLAKTPEDREKRALLFLRWDPNGNGYLSLAEIDKGVQETKGLEALFSCKPAIIRAYKAAKGLKKGREGSKDDDYVSKIEFRMLLVYLKLYFGLFSIFAEMDTGHDRRVDKEEFRRAAPTLRELGCPISDDPDETFAKVDKDGGGQILFNEFCEWAIANNILAENTAGPPVPPPAVLAASVILPKIEEVSEEERYSSDEDREHSDIDDKEAQEVDEPVAPDDAAHEDPAAPEAEPVAEEAAQSSMGLESMSMSGLESVTGESWATIAGRLPVELSSEDKLKRAQLFSLWDPNGNGFLSLAEVDRGVSITQGLEELYKCKPALIRAFNSAKTLKPADPNKKGLQDDDYVSRIEFRMLLVYLKLYFGLFQIFDQIDTGHDRRVDVQEFRAAAEDLRSLGCPVAQNPDETFRVIDKDNGGQILFTEFCEWAVANNLLVDPRTEGKRPQRQPAATIPQTEVALLALPASDCAEKADEPLHGLVTSVRGQVRDLNTELSDMKKKIMEAMQKRSQDKVRAHRGFGLPPPRVANLVVREPLKEDAPPAPSPAASAPSPSASRSPSAHPPAGAVNYTPRDHSSFKRLTTNFQRLQHPHPSEPAAPPREPTLPRTQSDGAKRLAERLWGDVKPRYLQRSRSHGGLAADRNALSSAGSESSVSSAISTKSEQVRMPTDKYVWGKGAAQRAQQRAEEIKRLERAEAVDKGRGLRVNPRDRLAHAQATLEFRGERHVERGAFRAQPTSVAGRPYEWGA